MAFLNYWTHPYELTPLISAREVALKPSRYGMLLKFEFEEEGTGYADLHPWIEFGEETVDVHLNSLETSSPTLLARLAVANAFTDAQARKNNKFLLIGTEQVENNALITDICSSDLVAQLQAYEKKNYTRVKVKLGQNINNETSALKILFKHTAMKVRLDANAQLSFQQASDFLEQLTIPEKSQIEYFEDPCPFAKNDWGHLRKQLPIALDWQSTNALSQGLPIAWDIVVIKPARQDVDFWLNVALKSNAKMVVTSSMDHPLGVAHALVRAAQIKSKFPDRTLVSGCQTLHLYQETKCSAWLKYQGPFLQPATSDVGLGFTALLEELEWK